MTDYKTMFEQAVRTLAEIDDALGIGDDGCCVSPGAMGSAALVERRKK